MGALPVVSEAVIRQHATAKVFERGLDYFQSGAVVALAQRGSTLEADVEGSEVEPYRVRVTFAKDGIAGADCTCEYEWGGWCKHIVAVLLQAHNEPEAIEERADLAVLLDALDAPQLRALVLKLLEREPKLSDTVETQIALLRSSPTKGTRADAAAPAAAGVLDPALFRRTMRAIIRDVRIAWEEFDYEGGMGEATSDLLEQARAFLHAGDGRNALVLLDAITDEYMTAWHDLEEWGEDDSFLTAAGRVLTEALLLADLSAAERQAWTIKLTRWNEEIENYGEEGPFAPAILAAEQGWDHPALRRLLSGEDSAGDGGIPGDVENVELASARLNILERQGRYDECLRLSAAAGLTVRHAIILVQLGRGEDAVAFGLARLTQPDGALALAKALDEHGHSERAVRVAAHGLGLGGDLVELADWVCRRAAAAGEGELAVRAARIAYDHDLDLRTYLQVKEVAGDAWSSNRDAMLALLRARPSYYPQGHVDIFLLEGLIADAMETVSHGAAPNLIEQVVDAAVAEHPEWVIVQCQRQATAIMNEGRSDHYDTAVRWLGKAKQAYLAQGQAAAWQEYLGNLLRLHARKYKLRPMLEALR